MSETIAFANQKGGTGKTTTVINLAGALAELGKRALVVDIDPQASLTIGFGIEPPDLERTIYDVMVEGHPIQTIIRQLREHIDIVPTNIYLSVAELKLAGEIRREDRLKNALAKVKNNYDYVLIDCPPSLGLLTINALAAADKVLIPMSCDFYSMVGVRLLLDTIHRIQDQLNPDLKILGILATRFDARTVHAKEVLQDTREKLGSHFKVFDAVIRESVRFKEAPIEGKTITEYSTNHPSAEDYRNFAKEFIYECQ
jgi:chromosome partitioning protein